MAKIKATQIILDKGDDTFEVEIVGRDVVSGKLSKTTIGISKSDIKSLVAILKKNKIKYDFDLPF